MAVETVLLALLGVVALWLAFDAGRERHRLRARMQRSQRTARTERTRRSEARRPPRAAVTDAVAGGPVAASGPLAPVPEAWRYWPLTLPATDDGSVGPRF